MKRFIFDAEKEEHHHLNREPIQVLCTNSVQTVIQQTSGGKKWTSIWCMQKEKWKTDMENIIFTQSWTLFVSIQCGILPFLRYVEFVTFSLYKLISFFVLLFLRFWMKNSKCVTTNILTVLSMTWKVQQFSKLNFCAKLRKCRCCELMLPKVIFLEAFSQLFFPHFLKLSVYWFEIDSF